MAGKAKRNTLWDSETLVVIMDFTAGKKGEIRLDIEWANG